MRVTAPRSALRSMALAALAAGALSTACDEDLAPAFVIEGSGAIEGLLFFDADRNQAYDPSAGDTVVAGATVLVRERGTDLALTGGQAVSNTAGRFRIASLPPGTHDLFVDTTTIPAGFFFCQNPRPVSVVIDAVRFVDVVARGGCVVAIEDAEAAGAGPFVTVQGIVTAAPGSYRTQGDNAYIEDQSGGIQLFGTALIGLGIAVGDRLEVSGTMTLFNDELEVTGLRVNEVVPNVTTPQPALVTTAEIAAAGSPPTQPLQGRFVRIVGAIHVSAFGNPGSGGRNAPFNDGSGASEVRIESGVLADTNAIDTQFPGGKCYDIIGVVGTFRGTAQLKPRSLADIQEVPCTP